MPERPAGVSLADEGWQSSAGNAGIRASASKAVLFVTLRPAFQYVIDAGLPAFT